VRSHRREVTTFAGYKTSSLPKHDGCERLTCPAINHNLTTMKLSIIINTIVTGVVWFGVRGNPLAEMLLYALVWLYVATIPLAFGTFMLLPHIPTKIKLSTARLIASHIADTVHISILVWAGWMWCAVIFGAQMAVIDLIYRKQKLMEKEAA
jgi:hypothetical protein